MKSITESINLNEAGKMRWEVFKEVSIPVIIATFAAPDKPYLWIYREGQSMAFETLADIESSFEEFGMEDDVDYIKALKVGESWCADGENIYLRLY